MKILFLTGGGQATVFALAPLATAVRGAGHEVLLAVNAAVLPAAAATGVPALAMTDRPLRDFITADREGQPVDLPLGEDGPGQARFTGGWFARMAAAGLDTLRELTATWRPDLIVGGTMSYAAPLLARQLGVPFVRQTWDAIDARQAHLGADRELRPELAELGLSELPEPDLFLDVCPPSLRPAGAGGATPMRYLPTNRQGPLEPWMYTRGTRRRICVTAGSQVTREGQHGLFEFLTGAVRSLTSLDAEILLAAPEELAPDLRAACGDVRAGWLPLDVVAPTCDAIVHHGGGVTSLTAMHSGTPQVVVPGAAMLADSARRLAEFGAGVVLPSDAEPKDVGEACRQVVVDEGFGQRAEVLRHEIAAMPAPSERVASLTALART